MSTLAVISVAVIIFAVIVSTIGFCLESFGGCSEEIAFARAFLWPLFILRPFRVPLRFLARHARNIVFEEKLLDH